MPHRITISNRQRDVSLDRASLRAAVRAVLNGEHIRDAEIGLAIVDDTEGARVNWQFLRHRGPTDVITFPLNQQPLCGELVIGAEVARRVAAERGHALAAEMALYVIHGVLHLCGYDDKFAGPRKKMRQREAHFLAQLGLPAINEPN